MLHDINDSVDQSDIEDDNYVKETQMGWASVEEVNFSTSTRSSEVQWYDQLGEKCEEWGEICKQTFADMIRSCICGVSELRSVRISSFELLEADPQYMIDGDVPSRVLNSGLPGHYVVETHGDKKYMEWLLVSDIDERQVLQCVYVGTRVKP
jgi:hypothetical protein